jgi:hypothetical protein
MSRRVRFGAESAKKIHATFTSRYLDGRLLEKPLWYDVVASFPPMHTPTALPQHDSTRFIQDAALPPKAHAERMRVVEGYCLNMQTNKWLKYKHRPRRVVARAVREAALTLPIPHDIVYPEDALRDRFFSDHPPEKLRPMTMQGDLAVSERVVQRVVELMERQGVGQEDAYKSACREFYKETAKENAEALAARAKLLGAEPLAPIGDAVAVGDDAVQADGAKIEKKADSMKPVTDARIQQENDAIQSGLENKARVLEEQRQRAISRRQSAAI